MNAGGQIEFIMQYGTDKQKKSARKIMLANDVAKVKKMQMKAKYEQRLVEEANNLGIENFEKHQIELSKEKEEYEKYSSEGRTRLSKADLMQMEMAFRQDDVIDLATRRKESGELVNPDLNRRYNLMPQVRQELNKQDIALAEKMGEILNELLPEVNGTFRKQYGVDMKVQARNYFPLKVQTKKGGFKNQMSSISVAPGFTISRTAHSNDFDERSNIFEVFSAHIEDAAHYVQTYDSQAGLRTTLTNRHFKKD